MEYRILNISPDSSVEEAHKAMKKIRIDLHPDKNINLNKKQLEIHKRLLNLSENAFDIIIKRQNTKHVIATSSLDLNEFMTRPESLFNITKANVISNATYEYTNTNGKVNERGSINGNPMTRKQLDSMRNNSSMFHIRSPASLF